MRRHFGPLGAVDLNLGRQDVFRAQRRDMRDHLFPQVWEPVICGIRCIKEEPVFLRVMLLSSKLFLLKNLSQL